jgi:hypothetical protein
MLGVAQLLSAGGIERPSRTAALDDVVNFQPVLGIVEQAPHSIGIPRHLVSQGVQLGAVCKVAGIYQGRMNAWNAARRALWACTLA